MAVIADVPPFAEHAPEGVHLSRKIESDTLEELEVGIAERTRELGENQGQRVVEQNGQRCIAKSQTAVALQHPAYHSQQQYPVDPSQVHFSTGVVLKSVTPAGGCWEGKTIKHQKVDPHLLRWPDE